jgi:hypothetical protein
VLSYLAAAGQTNKLTVTTENIDADPSRFGVPGLTAEPSPGAAALGSPPRPSPTRGPVRSRGPRLGRNRT